jgi:site-specific DNA-cytosine methylase
LKGRLKEVRERLAAKQEQIPATDWDTPVPIPDPPAAPPVHTAPRFQEVFAGVAGLTRAVEREGVKVLDPVETFLDDSYVQKVSDLSSDTEFKRIRSRIRAGEVRWLHEAPPCITFTMARRSDQYGTAVILRTADAPEGIDPLLPRVAEANLLMKRSAMLAKACIRAGCWFSIENPKRSFA